MNMKMSDFINNIPYLTANVIGEELYGKYQNALEWLRSHYKGVITGLWHINAPADDGGLQAIIRYAYKLNDEKFDIHGGVGDILHHESLWVVIGDDTSGVDYMIGEFFSSDDIYCVFDDNR